MTLMERRRALMSGKSNIAYEAYNIVTNGTNYVNTGIKLFSAENINRDFEVSLIGIYGEIVPNPTSNTFICAKHNTDSTGFLIRFAQNKPAQEYNGTMFLKNNVKVNVIFRRINGVITAEGPFLNPKNRIVNAIHNLPLVIGCALQDNGIPYRFYAGSLDHIIIKWL